MYAEPHRLAWAVLIALAATTAQAATEQVFEPGSKHVCVPAANGEGWDCHSTEAAPAAPAANDNKPREPRLRSSSQVPDETPKAEATAAGAAEPAAAAPATTAPAAAPSAAPPPSVAAPRANSRNVPNYLLAPEARASNAPSPAPAPSAASQTAGQAAAPAAAAGAVRDEPAPETPAAKPAATSPQPVAAAPPEPAPAATSPPEPAAAAPPPVAPPEPVAELPAPRIANPPAAPPPPPVANASPLLGAAEFRRLGDSRYVIELASGSSRDAVEQQAASHAAGDVYLLPLRRDGETWYLAVRGDFDSVDAARAARAEAIASGAANIGWPRRVGPLKQELDR